MIEISATLIPDRVTMSAWTGHVPFAFSLIKMLSPKIFVELGTHTGTSYFAFCQSVSAFKISTRCYAIDTWKGDEHAGLYGEEIFADVATYHDQHYTAFSRLLRMTFDDALPHFSDASIDLLHIDGLHTYEAVRHDFENWLPKMSNRGVVLFHDINVRQGDFGVWKLWEELSAEYPHLSFDHAHGLGVLAVGQEIPEKLYQMLCEFRSSDGQHRIKTFFARLGKLVEIEHRLGGLEKELAVLQLHSEGLESTLAQERDLREKAQS
ncbi:class I SAM-dependent methyltransferase, partial [bacterium]|nr:class I SAM-dependent methyltransferase [bacterium]